MKYYRRRGSERGRASPPIRPGPATGRARVHWVASGGVQLEVRQHALRVKPYIIIIQYRRPPSFPFHGRKKERTRERNREGVRGAGRHRGVSLRFE